MLAVSVHPLRFQIHRDEATARASLQNFIKQTPSLSRFSLNKRLPSSRAPTRVNIRSERLWLH